MKWHRVKALLIRQWYHNIHDVGSMISPFYWPLVDMVLWGLTSLYIGSIASEQTKIVAALVSGVLFWTIVVRSFTDLTVFFAMERWDRNLINLFASPLHVYEWLVSLLIFMFMRTFAGFVFVATMAYILYKLNIFIYGIYLLPFIGLLFLSGCWIAFVIAGFNILKGRKVDVFIWTVMAFFSPFSAVFYPVSFLPDWAQKVSQLLPQTYVFEGMRDILENGTININFIIISLALNLFYLIVSVIFFRWCFSKLLEKGLVNVN